MTYAKRDGIRPMGTDRNGVPVWRLRGADGDGFDERFHGSRSAARKRYSDLRHDVARGVLAADKATSVADLLDSYITHRVSLGKVRPGKSEDVYRGYVSASINSVIGDMPIAKVRTVDAQRVIDQRVRAGKSWRQPYVVAKGAFAWAVRSNMISVNPFVGVTLPSPHRARLTIPTAEQVGAILGAGEEQYRVPLALAAATGLRRGEVVGLRWGDLRNDSDGEFTSLHVDGTMQRVAGELRRPPKSERGYRDVPIPPSLSTMLRRRKAQTERRLQLGEAWVDTDLIADRGDGSPLDPDTFGDAFRRACEKAGVPGVRLHDLRHHYGTIMVGAGVDIVTVSRALGHASTILINVYTHPTEEMSAPLARTAEDALGEALGKL